MRIGLSVSVMIVGWGDGGIGGWVMISKRVSGSDLVVNMTPIYRNTMIAVDFGSWLHIVEVMLNQSRSMGRTGWSRFRCDSTQYIWDSE